MRKSVQQIEYTSPILAGVTVDAMAVNRFDDVLAMANWKVIYTEM